MPVRKMDTYFLIIWSLLFSVTIPVVLLSVSSHRNLWPIRGIIKIKCPYEKINLNQFNKTVDPCPDLKQPICGTNFVTYANPCILYLESLKSNGRVKHFRYGRC